MARPHEHLPRLNIPPSLNLQQPLGFDRMQQAALYSPALPTLPQSGFHPSFPINNSMQTPMQAFFNPQVPPAPGRPTHRQGQSSIQFAGPMHPGGFAMTPLTGHFSRHSMALGPGQMFPGQPGQPFPGKHRKQMSIGGPPKAALGGPGRNHSPLPVPVAVAAAVAPPPKTKKVTVNLPKESGLGDDGEARERPEWARNPIPISEIPDVDNSPPVETMSAAIYPPDFLRDHIPDMVDVFLPGKRAWEDLKQKAIEEKLEKLGVERGSGSNVPHIFAPHARAASISSPADPALLMFRLNKLQQQQTTSATNSISSSPQPPFALSPSPHQVPPHLISNRHGHSLSLAQPPSRQWPAFNDGSNPFGPNAVLGSDHTPYSQPSPGIRSVDMDPYDAIHAPQGHMPISPSSLAPPLSAVRPPSRPDFIRGFGLDIPEEEEPEEEQEQEDERDDPEDTEDALVDEEAQPQEDTSFLTNDADISHTDDENVLTEEDTGEMDLVRRDGSSTVAQSRLHSRHVSRLSGALTLVSVGGVMEGEDLDIAQSDAVRRTHAGDQDTDIDEDAAIEEWTGSEDLYMDGTSDDESIGEWSNPSDEERARQQRLERRLRKRSGHHEIQTGRRLPNFPRPPDTTIAIPFRHDADDIISNPSEEERIRDQAAEFLHVNGGDYYQHRSQLSGSGSRSPRPLPPLPHSRATSVAQLSSHDPAYAHSRGPSEQSMYPPAHQTHQAQPSHSSLTSGRRDSLNPFAKPFVFGAPRGSGSWTPQSVESPHHQQPSFTHARTSSFGKPLNVAAPEFKPTGFNFSLPPGVPQMSLPEPQPRPLPDIPVDTVSGPSRQGREKRLRLDDPSSPIEEGDSMHSFKFPPSDDTGSMRRASTPKNDGDKLKLNPSAEPFTFPGLPFIPKQEPLSDDIEVENDDGSVVEESLHDDSTARAVNGDPEVSEFSLPSASKPKRQPIPLSFTHPVSNNTVPAGLFKALNSNGEDRTRRSVRSRLGSREMDLSRRPSLDDMQIPTISRKISRSLRMNEEAHVDDDQSPEREEEEEEEEGDLFGPHLSQHKKRRSSLPLPLHSAGSTNSGMSIPAIDLSGRIELNQLEHRLESLLDDKFSGLARDLSGKLVKGAAQNGGLHLDDQISHIVSLVKTHLQESAIRGAEDHRLDGRGESDLDVIKHAIQQGQRDAIALLQQELHSVVDRSRGTSSPQEMYQLIESFSSRTINAVVEAISELSARLETVERGAPAREHDVLVDQIMSGLIPMVSSLRTDPVDYDLLTHQLSQAVKPHISQLIDLASDKRETAGLIVDRILPLLPNVEADDIVLKLTNEIRRAIAPIDAFEIREKVADLVVERLDSRLAVRDKAISIDTFSAKVSESVGSLVEPVNDLASRLSKIEEVHSSLSSGQSELSSWSKTITERLTALANQLRATVEVFNGVEKARAETIDTDTNHVNETMKIIKASIDAIDGELGLSVARDRLALEQIKETKDIASVVSGFVQASHGDLVKRLSNLQAKVDHLDELDTLRQEKADLTLQLTRARSSHGQVRVEKDLLSEKYNELESECEGLRSRLKDAEDSAAKKSTETIAADARSKELEEALAQALSRLQASDVATQTQQARIAELEKTNRDLAAEKQSLKAKADSSDLQVVWAKRDKETAEQNVAVLQKQNEYFTSQQEHWDALKVASAQLDTLTKLVSLSDENELRELRQIRDRSKVLEGEHVALQKRLRDQEMKMTNADKASAQLRQSLTQNQQRALEWESRAKESEAQLELTRTELDQSEQRLAQLDADFSLAKLQLDEKEADDRLTKDNELKLNEKVSTLEAKVARLQDELEKTKRLQPPTTTAIPVRKLTNGAHVPPRPDSRTSTIYGDHRATTPNIRSVSQTLSHRSNTPPNQKSVWDSIHAPSTHNGYTSIHSPVPSRYPIGHGAPRARHTQPSQLSRMSAASPTPSVVSQAPTLGDDGWYS